MDESKENLETDYLSEKETEIVNTAITKVKEQYPNACKVCITKVNKMISAEVNDSSYLMINIIPLDAENNPIVDYGVHYTTVSFLTTEMFTSLNAIGLEPYEQFCRFDWNRFEYSLEYDEDSHKLYINPYWGNAQKVVIKSSSDTDQDNISSAAAYISSSWCNIGHQYVSKIDTMMDLEQDECGEDRPVLITTVYLKVLQTLNLDTLIIK